MRTFRTIAATAIVTLAATAVAFGGVHLGQSTAGASATPTASPKATQATYTVRLTEGQLEHLAKLLGGQKATVHAQQHARHEAGHDTPVRTVYRQTTSAGSDATQHAQTHHSAATIFRDGDHSTCIGSGCNDGGGCGDDGGCD